MQNINPASVNGLLSTEATQALHVYTITKSAQQITKWLKTVVRAQWICYLCTFSSVFSASVKNKFTQDWIQISKILRNGEFDLRKWPWNLAAFSSEWIFTWTTSFSVFLLPLWMETQMYQYDYSLSPNRASHGDRGAKCAGQGKQSE